MTIICCSKYVHCQILKLKLDSQLLEPQHPQHCIARVNVSYSMIHSLEQRGRCRIHRGKEINSIRDNLEEQQ